MKFVFIKYIVLSIIIIACSSVEKTTKESESKPLNVYVFDNVEKIDSVRNNDENADSIIAKELINKKANKPEYIIQLGAFSSKEKAEMFVNENQNKTEFKLNIIFKKELNVYAVQLSPFNSILEAEKVRDNLQKINSFKNAYIITINE